jgi:predicted permease
MLLKHRGFAAAAILVLGLGIGATTAIFSLINGVLLRPLPFQDPQALVAIQEVKEGDDSWRTASLDDVNDFRDRQQSFSHIASFTAPWTMNLAGREGARQVLGQFVSSSFLSTFGVAPRYGRDFLPEEDAKGSQQHVVILSHAFWQREFGGDLKLLGQTITLDEASFTVIGVMPPGFKVTEESDFFVPLALNPMASRGRNLRFLSVVGRMNPGVTLPQAQAELEVIARQLENQYPDTNKGYGVSILPLQEQIVGKLRPALLVLIGAVAFVLLIACANVANLTLTRAVLRQKEIAIRLAIGAGRARLIRQLLTESALLSLAGGILGLMLAAWGVDLFRTFGPPDIPRRDEIAIDGAVLLFTLCVSLFTGLLFGLAPAWKVSRADLTRALNQGGKGSTAGEGHRRYRGALIVSEIALAVILLTGAGLLIKSFSRLLQIDPGFNSSRLLALQLNLPPSKYGEPPQRAAYYQQLEERLRALPGVQSVGAISRLPLFAGDIRSGRSNITSDLQLEGVSTSLGDRPSVDYRIASPSYFQTMGIPLVRGHVFGWQDQPQSEKGAPLVVVVNEAMARQFWRNADAVGQRIKVGPTNPESPWLTIVGVVGNVRHFGLDSEPRPEVYRPYLVNPMGTPIVVVRTATDPRAVAAMVRDQVRAVDPAVSLSNMATMSELISRSVSGRRFSTVLLTAFAAVALTLATIGIYAVIAYSVTQRTQEIGIRMALGAQAGDILKIIVKQGMALTLIGVALGVVGALALTHIMSSLLFGVRATDPATFASISLLLVLVAFIACYIPARRAARLDPIKALASQ